MVTMKNIRQKGFVRGRNGNIKDAKNNKPKNSKPLPKSTGFAVVCPWCERPTIILSINCGIFRHGVFKKNMVQIPPHASKNVCDKLVSENKIYGCGKPFRIGKDGIASKCDYI